MIVQSETPLSKYFEKVDAACGRKYSNLIRVLGYKMHVNTSLARAECSRLLHKFRHCRTLDTGLEDVISSRKNGKSFCIKNSRLVLIFSLDVAQIRNIRDLGRIFVQQKRVWVRKM